MSTANPDRSQLGGNPVATSYSQSNTLDGRRFFRPLGLADTDGMRRPATPTAVPHVDESEALHKRIRDRITADPRDLPGPLLEAANILLGEGVCAGDRSDDAISAVVAAVLAISVSMTTEGSNGE